MKTVCTLSLSLAALAASLVPASAAQWTIICPVPEIDGPAGISAIAALISVGMVAYDRLKG
ncbi:MAG: hypothetical protein NW223_01740 [Hyphomicrobiaceae bacterium]|nr:hypothetical protein [Hyphomicrobiaceae bacterium]